MDFFANQDTARRKTKWLVAYFAVAVVLIIVSLYAVAIVAMRMGSAKLQLNNGGAPAVDLWQPELLGAVTLVTLAIIFIGSLYKTFELAPRRRNRRHDARWPSPQPRWRFAKRTTIAQHRRRNGNRFGFARSAGLRARRRTGYQRLRRRLYTLDDAVIGVNRGTIEYLSRDELQGVIAHEFSHILNGDMRLNIRLIGILHGILLIAIIGYYILRSGAHSGGSRRSSEGGGGALAILGVGLGAVVIGYIGLFFGRLIKAAVSRQREYLADASACSSPAIPRVSPAR